MFGYVTTENAELKMKEFQRYSGYYCGICKSLGDRYGQVPRLLLSYDAAFLALLLAGVSGEDQNMSREHCLVHHLQRKVVIRCDAIDYSADVMVLLSWYQLKDDADDEGRLPSRMLARATRHLFRKARRRRPDLERQIRWGLTTLSLVEDQRSADLDEAGDAFGKIMEALATGYEPAADQNRLLSRIGYHLGRWIYLMDAWEDIEDNAKSGAYNPLLLRFSFQATKETCEEFRDRIREDVERHLMLYLSELSLATDLLEIRTNQDIIENVIYMGLLRRTERALQGDFTPNPKPPREAGEQIHHGKPL